MVKYRLKKGRSQISMINGPYKGIYKQGEEYATRPPCHKADFEAVPVKAKKKAKVSK